MTTIRIATRQSKLALWQANHVKDLLESAYAGLQCELIGMTTQGDRNKISPLSELGGKGVFVKELETALLEGAADIAVHSMKDVPGILPDGLHIAAICERASAKDAFISNAYTSLEEMPAGANVGSSSLRRVIQLKVAFPTLTFSELRGNVGTRLDKLDAGEYDGIILAVAGLQRLGLADRICEQISTQVSVPAAGQGAVGIESRVDDTVITPLLDAINHQATDVCVSAEREVTKALEATCNLPIAVFAQLQDEQIQLSAFLSDVAGTRVIRGQLSGQSSEANELARQLSESLFAQGAKELLG